MADHPKSHVLLNGLSLPNAVDEVALQAVGPERRLEIRIDAGPLARPAEIHCYRREGGSSPWPLHQHAHRLTLARLHRLLTTGEGDLSYSLSRSPSRCSTRRGADGLTAMRCSPAARSEAACESTSQQRWISGGRTRSP